MLDDYISGEERAARRRNLFGGILGNIMPLEEIIQYLSEHDTKYYLSYNV